MSHVILRPVFGNARLLLPVLVAVTFSRACAGEETPRDSRTDSITPHAPSLTPYSDDQDDLWNRLHRSLFVRTDQDQKPHTHSTDPLLYRGGTFLLEGASHRRAVELLDEFLAASEKRPIQEPLQRLFLQRDLWAAFDYAAWYPDDWVHPSKHEPAAIALRTRLAKAIHTLSLDHREINALEDNYAQAVKSMEFLSDYDVELPERLFLPPDLFDPSGPWVRFHVRKSEPMASEHFKGAGGRAVHIIFLRLPEGRAATERYLAKLGRDSVEQFPPGTMVAMVRRALAVDKAAKVRLTPVTELVQIRAYRRIPKDPRANHHGDFGEQDVYEFVLDRSQLFAGKHGLRPVGPLDAVQPFDRGVGDPFESRDRPIVIGRARTQLKSCIQCHQAPGIHSVTSMRRGLQEPDHENFPTYVWNVEINYTVRAKVQRYDWGFLQGMMEAR